MAQFTGGPGADFIAGTTGDDIISGLGGNDFLNGGRGADALDGGADSDTLQGDGFDFFSGKGADTLTGGTGDDNFEFSVFDGDSTSGNLDIVTDFEGAGVEGGDSLQLRASFIVPGARLSFGGARAAPAADAELGTAGDGVAEIFYASSGTGTLVFGDTNDNGVYDAQDFAVLLSGTHPLIASDFGSTDFVIAGTGGDDTITGTEGDDEIFAGGGNDTVEALGGSDRVDGGAGNDVLAGGEGNDLVLGGAGDDQVAGGGGIDSVQAGQGNDQLDGGDGDDALIGGEGDDILAGGAGTDTLSGDETLPGVLGADLLTGGAGADSFVWHLGAPSSTSTVQDRVTDFEGAGAAGGDLLLLRLPSLPQMQLSFGGNKVLPAFGTSVGTAGDGLATLSYAFVAGDTVVFTDSDDDGIFEATDFAARLTGVHNLVQSDFRLVTDRGDTTFVVAGTAGNDNLTGTDGGETVLGLGGNDTINAKGGNDRVEAGDGNDTVDGGAGDDNLGGGAGADSMSGGAGNDALSGGAGQDILNGNDGIDRITGGDGNDIIDGGAGRDTVLAGGAGNDIVRGGDGNDTLDGDEGNDTLQGGNDNDTLFGLDGNDLLEGDAGNDDLFGGLGADQLNGGAGVDELEGEEGADIIAGGTGDDQFDFNAGSFQPDSVLAAQDLVTDFEGAGADGGDVLRVSGDTFAFVGNLDVKAQAGETLSGANDGVTQLGYTQRAGSTYLIGDSNDNGRLDTDDFVVRFQGTRDFTVGDFENTNFVTVGTAGDDIIVGTEGDDRIFAGSGDDQVSGLDGSDEVHGGTGNDTLDGGPGGFDSLLGDEGNDTLTLATSNSGGLAEGGDGDDVLFGSDTSFGSFDHTLDGGAGNDVLNAGAVGSTMNGGTGADRLVSSAADDQMSAGSFGPDTAQDIFVYSGDGRWSADGSFYGDTISDFEDGVDRIELRGTGLQYSDLTIINEDFQTTILSDRGQITLFEGFDQPVFIDHNDFLFT